MDLEGIDTLKGILELIWSSDEMLRYFVCLVMHRRVKRHHEKTKQSTNCVLCISILLTCVFGILQDHVSKSKPSISMIHRDPVLQCFTEPTHHQPEEADSGSAVNPQHLPQHNL